MDENKPIDQPMDMHPNPIYGMPEPPSLEVTRYLCENQVFVRDKNAGEDEIIEGDLPPYIKYHFWSYLNKDMVLTNIRNERDVYAIQNQLEISIDSFEMKLPPGKFTWQTLNDLDNLRHIVKMRLLRAWQGMERKLEATQIQQQLYGSADPQPMQQKPGIMGRVFGRF
jgi:hypothetical protein